MSYLLYGSQTSPFVRRIRILLENIPYEFKELNIYEGQDAIDINKINPINQIPVLIDGENTIWDSRIIFNYLNAIHRFQNMDWQDENLLTAIDGAMNSGTSLLLMKRSGIDINENYMFVSRQKDRIESILDYLKPFVADQGLKQWDFHSISLYSFLDWATYRGVVKLENRTDYLNFMETHKARSIVTSTAIPKV